MAERNSNGIVGYLDDSILDPADELFKLLGKEYYLKLCAVLSGIKLEERLETALSFVTERDANVLAHRIGLINKVIYSLEFIGSIGCEPVDDNKLNRARSRSRGNDRLQRAVAHLKEYLDSLEA